MKILVPTKRVPDTDQKIVASGDGSCIQLEHIPYVINPFDAIALEEAVRISEQLGDSVEVVAVGIGAPGYEPQLRTALAMGAARAIHIDCGEPLDPWNVARLLRVIVDREKPQLVLMGKQAVDDDANQTGQFLAALLDWPQATFASKVDINGDGATVKREIDGGLETVEVGLPAVVTTDLRLNEPRYATLPNIMKAKKKPLETVTPAALGVDVTPRLKTLKVVEPPKRTAGVKVASVDELVTKLKTLGVVA